MGFSAAPTPSFIKLLSLAVVLCFMCSCGQERREQPVAVDGVIDLSDWDLDKDGPVTLAGEWRFVWNELIGPMPLDDFRETYTATYPVPKLWDPNILAKEKSGINAWEAMRLGYGTYALEIRLPKNFSNQILITQFYTLNPTRIIVLGEDGARRLGEFGFETPNETSGKSPARYGMISMQTHPLGHQRLLVLLQQARLSTAFGGGLTLVPTLYTQSNNPASIYRSLFTIIVGCLLGLGFYFAMGFQSRRQDKHLFYLSAFLLSVGILALFVYERTLLSDVTQADWLGDRSVGLQVTVMGHIINAINLYLFYRHCFDLSRFNAKRVLIPALLHILVTLTQVLFDTPNHVFYHFIGFGLYALWMGEFLRQCFAGIVLEAFRGESRAIAHTLAVTPVALLFFLTLLLLSGVTQVQIGFMPLSLAYMGAILITSLLLSRVVSQESAAAFSHAEHLSENLQREVASQTEALNITTQEALREKAHAQTAELEAQALREKAEEQAMVLQELDQQKTAFFQNMSHELRTPLTLILNPLEAESKEQPQNKNLEVATKNSRRLLRLVNQLLDFQKLEAGKQELQLAPLDINRFAYICGDYFYSACSTKGVAFSIHRNAQPIEREAEPIWIMSEVNALEKVAFNYLSNALKYTPKDGAIELGLTQQPDRIRLFVKDSGAGISKEGQAKLFQVFSQVDETTTRAYEGTGLGLALVKSLVEEMGGEVGVESEPGKGSTFWAEFPLCEAPAESKDLDFQVKSWLVEQSQGETGTDDTDSLEAHAEAADGASELVLVVDDLDDMRDLIAGSLKKRNYRVATAPNGRRGVEIAKKIKPSLIITDWMMPQMTGPQLIEALKGDDELNSVPIVLLTAKSDDESKLIGTEIGADSFLGKPFNDQELGSIVKNLLSLKSREREVEKLNHMLTETVLKRYISPALVDKIISGEISMDKPAEMRCITVLFSDLSGFTKTSEKLGPQVISSFLNEYLTKMNDIIFEHGGTIDKFIGDAIMVMFGAPQDMTAAEQAKRAADCALAMQREMETIVSDWESEGAGHLRMRIGLHQGEAIVGNFGSDKRSDYTCIGPTVNLAARIESAGEPGHVFLSSELSELLPQDVSIDAGLFQLKGIDGERRLYKLVTA